MNDSNNGLIQEMVNAFGEFLIAHSMSVVFEHEIPSGYQLQIREGINKITVSFYSTGKILAQGKASELKAKIDSWINETQLKPSVISKSRTQEQNQSGTSKFYAVHDEFDSVKELLLEVKAESKREETGLEPHVIFRMSFREHNQRVIATLYQNGTLLIQGRLGELFDRICEVLEAILPQSFVERGSRYVPDTNRDIVLSHMNRPDSEQKALDWVYEHLSEMVFKFLTQNDQETYLSGAGLLLSAKATRLALPDYSVVVMPFARAYEGFIIQLAIELNLADSKKIEINYRTVKVAEYLVKIKDKIEQVDKGGRYEGVVDDLQSAWRNIRNKILHSDPVNRMPHREIKDAEQDIQVFTRAMRRAYEYIVTRKIMDKTS